MQPRGLLATLLLISCLALSTPWAYAAEPLAVPEFKALVTDLTGTLSKDESAQLETELTEFERHKGSQLALLIVNTTAPETIEQFSLRVVEAWKLGRKGTDDGVLLTIAKKDRTLRIEVGYGLEGSLNDATARRIIDETVVPHLREGRFFNAAQAGLQQIMRVIEGEALPPPAAGADGHGISTDEFPFYFLTVLAIIFGGLFVRKRFGRFITGAVSSLLVGVLTWIFTESSGPTGGMMLLVLVGVALADGGSGSGSSGRRGRSSRSSGGRSGGGGSFGGGGASGRW